MSARYEVPALTRERQARVSDPAVSAWVSANAGSGKTTVLVRRVIRLLLSGVPPARILCLTYTKAAAAHMANKVLKTLGNWVRLDDAALAAELAAIDPMPLAPERHARARRLFAAAIETPGGLKVQTIHAFCDRVLHQFPFEACVPAGFEVLDEIRETDLIERARNAVLIEAAADPASKLGKAFALAVSVAADKTFEETLEQAVRDRRKILSLAEKDMERSIAKAFGLKPGETSAQVDSEIVTKAHLPRSEWASVAARLQSMGGNAAGRGRALAEAAMIEGLEAAESYLSVFLNDQGEPRADSGFGAQKAREVEPELFARLFSERGRLVPLFEKRIAAHAGERSVALLVLAEALIQRYEQAKRMRGFLDYADLIDKTADMLGDIASSWVLYKLDGGIDHVLIDEAQDTSPQQWDVIAKLTEEFFAGRGAREDQKRTVFAVGDEKQSIFGFQGADPARFELMRREFSQRAEAAGASFRPERLDLSFRSAPTVLGAIDKVFERPEARAGLSSINDVPIVHEAIRSRAPALVEIWPAIKPEADEDDGLAWDAPLDARSASSPTVLLAQRIAKAVKFWLGGGIAVGDDDKRRVPRAGDVIVLVRRRGALFEAILQALKQAEVPVAGADRLKLTDHIAVMDLLALGDALTLEADDLALACALKSPLFDLSEDELFELAHGRKGTLAAALAEKVGDIPRFEQAHARLQRWREESQRLKPFDFFSRVLGRDEGRKRMLSRLGSEAADALDEFLARALAYEASEAASLGGFVAFLRRAGTEVKRDLEIESDTVRVMTVHGAKGLEAPIVVLADTTSLPDGRHDPRLLAMPVPDSPPGAPQALGWALKQETDGKALGAAREAARAIRTAEYRRLLYVALTRAADALIVCGSESKRSANSELPEACWYRLVHDALKGSSEASELIETEVPYAGEKVWRWRPEAARPAAPLAEKPRQEIVLPAWLSRAAPPSPPRPRRIVPSDIPMGEAALPAAKAAGSPAEALRRGDLLHRLLQSLPELPAASRKPAAASFLASAAGDWPTEIRQAIAAEAIAVLDHPDIAFLFGPQSRAEIPLLARLPGTPELAVSGRIDRLAVTPQAVLIADFKTDQCPPSGPGLAPAAYVAQLALYKAAMERVFPGRALRTFLVWTAIPAIHEIPPERLEAAFRQAAGQDLDVPA